MRAVRSKRPEDENVRYCFGNQGQYAKKIERREESKVGRAVERANKEVRLVKQVADVGVRERWRVHPHALLHLAVFHDEAGGALYDVLVRGSAGKQRSQKMSNDVHATFRISSSYANESKQLSRATRSNSVAISRKRRSQRKLPDEITV